MIFSILVMFWGRGGYAPVCLAIGAPTSPAISNILMYRFDTAISHYAQTEGIKYTRYADDITLSSSHFLDRTRAIQQVEATLRRMRQPRLTLNPSKTQLASMATTRQVTGLILANDQTVLLGRERKRTISSMVHHAIKGDLEVEALAKLKGILAFAQDVEPKFIAMLQRKYGANELELLRRA
jgi:RNA-directed DNA polymerase